MIVIGLTGSLAMGKSTASRMMARLGLPVHDADEAVHRLLGPGGSAVADVAALFPEALRGTAIDRKVLGKRVFASPADLAKLESALHPRVRDMARRFLARQRRAGRTMAVLSIPLLFETGAERFCDRVIVVTAPRFIQEARALSRPGMTRERLEAIRVRQLTEHEKCRRADFVVLTGRSKGYTWRQLRRILRCLKCRRHGDLGDKGECRDA